MLLSKEMYESVATPALGLRGVNRVVEYEPESWSTIYIVERKFLPPPTSLTD